MIGRATIRIQPSEVAEEHDSARILTLPWTRPSPYRKREIIQGANDAKTYARPMPARARAILIGTDRRLRRLPGGAEGIRSTSLLTMGSTLSGSLPNEFRG